MFSVKTLDQKTNIKQIISYARGITALYTYIIISAGLIIIFVTWLICKSPSEGFITVPLGGVSSILLISQKPTGKMEGDVLW